MNIFSQIIKHWTGNYTNSLDEVTLVAQHALLVISVRKKRRFSDNGNGNALWENMVHQGENTM